ncbi:hypothetical protein [Erythrobacter crassostreae]|uniref:Peptidase inhibitor I78 family protein n=1 Tax=Erythrobacter crassostreae TaxID=2828328 RepID=A0A9X1JPW5_9SPHN|nr:hypothetical protein [Erythrobacter crassostrea]MBV7259867.1 hypothetical protein [Erythrobacter crassostrea]
MAIKRASIAALAMLALPACGNTPNSSDSTTAAAEDFAARINGPATEAGDDAANPAATTATAVQGSPSGAPTVAPPLPNAAAGPFVAGTATDPNSATCDANRMGPFIGRVADAPTQTDIENVVLLGREIRWLRPNAPAFNTDAASPRLNIMLDTQDIIRDARCG